MPGDEVVADESVSSLATRPRKQPATGGAGPAAQGVHYDPPPADVVQLTPVTGPMTVTLSASPDTGWPTLNTFLQATKADLTCAMYDFTAPHILNAFKSVMTKATGEFQLVLDANRPQVGGGGDPEHNPKGADFQESDVIRALRARWAISSTILGRRFPGKENHSVGFSKAHTISRWRYATVRRFGFPAGTGNLPTSPTSIRPCQTLIFPTCEESTTGIGISSWKTANWRSIYEKFIKWDAQQAKPLEVTGSALELEGPRCRIFS